jgi:hypothetical protein
MTQQKEDWIAKFWNTLFSASGPVDLNFTFGSNERTLGHLITCHGDARRLIVGGFSALNTRDISGEHCLFPIARNLARSIIVIFILIAEGADPLLRNHQGSTVVSQVLRDFPDYEPSLEEVAAIFGILRILLSSGSCTNNGVELAADGCDCPCSENGCLPTDALLPVFDDGDLWLKPRNVLWLLECLSIFQDLGRSDWARQSILSVLRHFKFDELGIQHHCKCAAVGGNHAETEPRFWDVIAEERKVERLEDEMARLRSMPTRDLEKLLLLAMRQSFEALLARREMIKLKKEREKRERKIKKTTHAVSNYLPSRLACCCYLMDLSLLISPFSKHR